MNRERYLLKALAASIVVLSVFSFPASVNAQRINGDIVGIVTDSSGGVIPGAQITVRNLDTGRELNRTTGVDGSFSFVDLAPGRYEVSATQAGFEKKVVRGLTLSPDQRIRADMSMTVGTVSTTVEVQSAGGQLVQPEAQDLSAVIETRRIEDLPVSGRSYLSLAVTTPGVILGGRQGLKSNTSAFTNRDNVSIWISGHRESDVNYIVDGIETRNGRWANVSFRPSIDMIKEFKIERGSYGGEMGIDGSAIVNIITKGGSNEFHGSVFDFLRNDALNARNFFDKQRPPFHDNDFGGVIGGPIVKNKLFFFGSFEGSRARLAQTLQGLFPSMAQMQGNLADDSVGTGVFPTNSQFCQGNPGSKKCKDVIDPDTGLPFTGNVIPTDRIANFSKGFAAQFLPEANALDRLPLGQNRLVNDPIRSEWNQWSVRIDYNLSARDTVFGRYIWVNEPYFQPGVTIGSGVHVPLRGRNFAGGWTRILSPNLVNTFHAGFNNGLWRQTAELIDPFNGGATNILADLGLKNTDSSPFLWGAPGVSLVGFTGLGSGFFFNGDDDTNIQFSDTASYIRGKHSIRLGGGYRRQHYQGVTRDSGASFGFDGGYTGSSIGDFLLGIPNQASHSLGDGTGDFYFNLYSIHATDTYRIRPNLTMNIGMGWEYKSPPAEANDKMAIFDFSQAKYLIGGKDFTGSPIDPFYGSYKPQLGFAWQPFGSSSKTVVRTGFGIYWSSQKLNDMEGLYLNWPFAINETLNSGAVPTLFVDDLFDPITVDPNEPHPINTEIQSRFMHEKRPYSPEWNLVIEQQFSQNWLVQIAYEGNSAIRGGSFNQANPGAIDPTGTIPLNDRRILYPGFGNMNLNTTMNHGYYHAGTVTLKKRFSQGLSLDLHYTMARQVDNGGNEISNADFPLIGRRGEKGNGDLDIHHRMVASYIYELPFGRGQRFLNQGGVADAVLGGWQFSGISIFQTGSPDKVTIPGNWLNTGTRISARPNCVADPNQSSFKDNVRSNGLIYFDTSAFQLPAPHTPGNCARNILRSPGINNWDISMQKNNRIGERLSLQTRFEFFNAWNHTQWNMFSSRSGGSYSYGEPGFGNASFGKVTSARNARIIQISMKLVF
jgi:Carboxypeptidase regulatory-like domain